jgi:hypothetical protein
MRNKIFKTLAIAIIFCFFISSQLIAVENRFKSENSSDFNKSYSQNHQRQFKYTKFDSKNILLSLLLPGLGEYVGGERGRAKVFFTSEVILWAGFIGSKAYSNTLKDDYRTYAAIHAGVQTANKGGQYWIDIGNANNIYIFNERRRVQRNLKATYPETDEYSWQWDQQENREEYADLRSKQNKWKNVSTYMIAGLIMNRIISAVDIVYLIRKNKDRDDLYGSSYFHFNYLPESVHGELMQLNFTWRF